MNSFFLFAPFWLVSILLLIQFKSLMYGFDSARSSWAWLICILLLGIYMEIRMLRKSAQRKRGEARKHD